MLKKHRNIALGSMSICGIGLFFAPFFWQTIASLLLIGFVGLPHGGIDGYQMWSQSGGSFRRFTEQIAKYVSIVLLGWATWWLWPAAFWAAFLAISVYHFGVSKDLFPSKSPVFSISKWVGFLSKGALVVFVPILSYPAATREILSVAASPSFADLLVAVAPTLVFLVLAAVLITAVIEQSTPSGKEFARSILLQSLLLLSLFSFLPALVSFALYFVFIHAIPQMQERQASLGHVNAKLLVAVGMAFSLPPIAVLAMALNREPSWATSAAQGSSYIFVLLGVLHFPHCWLSFAESRTPRTAQSPVPQAQLPAQLLATAVISLISLQPEIADKPN